LENGGLKCLTGYRVDARSAKSPAIEETKKVDKALLNELADTFNRCSQLSVDLTVFLHRLQLALGVRHVELPGMLAGK
jgi:hypothetical protein